MTKYKNTILFTGASATWKNTIVNKILERNKEKLYRLVVDTTRPPRKWEINGIDYNFISREEYFKKYNNNLYYWNDWTNEFNGNFYWTPKEWEKYIMNKDCIWMPTCVDVVKEIINSNFLIKERIKWIHLITDNLVRENRLKKRWISSEELKFRLSRWDTHNLENSADLNIDTWLYSIQEIVDILYPIF